MVVPGDLNDEATRAGSPEQRAAAEGIEDQVRRALDAGATARLEPQPRDGAKFSPVVLENITSANPAYREEFLGPVACSTG